MPLFPWRQFARDDFHRIEQLFLSPQVKPHVDDAVAPDSQERRIVITVRRVCAQQPLRKGVVTKEVLVRRLCAICGRRYTEGRHIAVDETPCAARRG